MSRLEQIKARCEAATPGPWWMEWESLHLGSYHQPGTVIDVESNDDNSEFLVNARDDIPWLIAEVERLRAENET